jgi:hypothetical protein
MAPARLSAVMKALLATLAVLSAGGCINLPPALERELECPAAGEPDNFGTHDTCVAPSLSSSR